MRHAIWGIPLLLAIGNRPAQGALTSYIIDFSTTSGSPTPASGFFSYDSSLVDSFSDFTVLWDGVAFDLDAGANAPSSDGTPTCIGSATGAAAMFLALTSCPGLQWVGYNDRSQSHNAIFDIGTAAPGFNPPYLVADDEPITAFGAESAMGTFTVEETPEPGTLGFMLIGLCWLGISGRAAFASRFAAPDPTARGRFGVLPTARV